jgi:hypothetical protein
MIQVKTNTNRMELFTNKIINVIRTYFLDVLSKLVGKKEQEKQPKSQYSKKTSGCIEKNR